MNRAEGKAGMRNRRKNQADKTERVKDIIKDELLKSKTIAQESRCGVSVK